MFMRLEEITKKWHTKNTAERDPNQVLWIPALKIQERRKDR